MVKKNRNKRIVSLIVLLIVLISITIGYSALSSTLNIKGTTNITKPTWNIHFENLVVNSAWNTTTTTVQTAPTIDSSGLKIGDSAVLCIHMLESGTRIAIPIEVDEYSVASIKGIYGKMSSETNTNFLAQVGTVTSVFPSVRIFYN